MDIHNSKADFESFGVPRAFGTSRKTHIYPSEVSQEIKDHFSKKFQLQHSNNYFIPSKESWFQEDKWKLNTFQELKQKLNTVKSILNDYNLKKWHQHTNFVNRSAKVIPLVKRLIKPQLTTQAWCKFYEIINSYPILPQSVESFSSAHLCEAPGAFIASLNHYLKCHHPGMQWDWIANTLNPHYEGNSFDAMISDDRLILGTHSKWYYGPDNSGNILQSMFIPHFQNYLKEKVNFKVLLVTADGSFDCQGNPGEQEILVGKLHYKEVQTGLAILNDQGNMVVKMFTIFESDTICLLYILVCLFETINLFKPATSKQGNSEIYIVCQNFHKSLYTLHAVDDMFSNSNDKKVLFSLDIIPKTFLLDLYNAVEYFTNLQIEAIHRNIDLYEKDIKSDTENCRKLEKLQNQIGYYYIHKYKLVPIPFNLHLMQDQNNSLKQRLSFDGRIENGTYKERLLKENSSLIQLVNEELVHIDEDCSQQDDIYWIEDIGSYNLDQLVCIIKGKSISQIKSSIFCLARLFKILYTIEKVKVGQQMQNEELHREDLFTKSLIKSSEINIERCEVIDLTDHLNLLSDNVAERHVQVLNLLINTIEVLPIGHHLLVINMSLFTQYCVSLVMLIGSLYKKVGLMLIHDDTVVSHSSHAVLFDELQSKNLDLLRKILVLSRDTLSSSANNECVVSILPVQFLCEQYKLFKTVFQINCCSSKNQLLELIKQSSNQS